MPSLTQPTQKAHPISRSMLMLSLLIVFTIFIFIAPYTGFYFNPSSGAVLQTYHPRSSALQVGDILIKVGDMFFYEYQQNASQPLFSSAMKPGHLVPITFNRNGEEQTIQWQMPGFNIVEFRGRLFNIWWLAYVFWILGACVEAFIRPPETRWRLMLASNHLTSLWIVLGAFSSWRLWYGSVLFHAVTWLLLPLYLHLSWIFPKPLGAHSKHWGFALYGIAAFFFISEIAQIAPRNLYLLAFVIALGGSTLIQIIRFIWKPEQRKQLTPLLNATAFSSIPLITLGAISIFGEIPSSAPLAIIFLIFIPIIYMYLILQHQLGGLEGKANLFISSFAFLILAGTLLIIAIYFISLLPPEMSALFDFLLPLLTATLSIHYFPTFQKYIEKKILGISIDYEKLQEKFSSLIITSTSLPKLQQLLEKEIFPSLLIRQYAFVQVQNRQLNPLLLKQVTQAQLPEKEAIPELSAKAGKFIPKLSPHDDWMRVILPLKLGDSTLGFFLLGQHDPDDLYHHTEISALQSIANQTAIALGNILYHEQLNQMYELGMDRYEEERKRLARDLHDSVLNELSEMRRNLGKDVSAEIQTSYAEVINRLRDIVNDIRPPMLMYGLAPAIKALAEDLMQKTGDTVKIIVEVQTTEERMTENIEVHLFWIVQEACKNSLHHAQASSIKISGSISPQTTNLLIEDDGIGFEMGETSNLGTILAKRHFGLVGMLERAHIIGAKLNIEPKPHTKIQILWDAEKRAFI